MLDDPVPVGQYGYVPFLPLPDHAVPVWRYPVSLGDQFPVQIRNVLVKVPIELDHTGLFRFSLPGLGIGKEKVIYTADNVK
ncbi:hypothetical protein [Sphingobacterium sp.]|uniref:hypothetical protein n=1 Tax=Sphingobacterium sp. TaxID=341027 RepID=UPI0028A7AE9E|nr:hypothetical protein [Sphingobacterium sp.]